MKRRLRQRQILDLLSAHAELSVEEACTKLGASPATVRREFALLAHEGRVAKTWGGIRAHPEAPGHLRPPAFATRLISQADEKKRIARAAADLLRDGDVVMIDGGTTTLQLAEFIALKRIRVVTNSLAIAIALDENRGSRLGAEIHLTGGLLQPESGFVAGPQAEAFIRRYHASWAFLGAAGVDERSATNYNEAVLESERLMIAQSERVALLVDHTKLGRRAMCELCPIGKVNQLITTENAAASPLLDAVEQAGVRVERVGDTAR
ncbi:MAG TPA: DeoR/GlpR family DNA-binding transcription regulator [Chthoniobacteraceae bacterium]